MVRLNSQVPDSSDLLSHSSPLRGKRESANHLFEETGEERSFSLSISEKDHGKRLDLFLAGTETESLPIPGKKMDR